MGGVVLATILGTGCVDGFLAPEPPNDPVAVFDELWTEVDRHYAFFESKQIDWEAVRDTYRPAVGPAMPLGELFQLLAETLDHLRDSHAGLWSPTRRYNYTDPDHDRPDPFDRQVTFAHLQGVARWTPSGRIAWGRLSTTVGYVYIPSFEPGGWAGEIDGVLEALDGMGALVVDVRGNGGGTDLVAEEILARFMDRERVYRHFRYRNGPAHDDFTELFPDRIAPAGHRFLGPVAVLTNRRTFSTAEDFVLGLETMGRVVTVGDSTGGGLGNPTHRELPNGWTFSVSRWQEFDADRRFLEDGVGLGPDVLVSVTPGDAAEGRDPVLLEAQRILEERLGPA